MSALEENARSLWERRPGGIGAVDGLRAVAVLWVIGYHTFKFIGAPLMHGSAERPFRLVNRGLLGVDVFFVLSGFLIGSMLMNELQDRRRLALGRFYLRRALRILPVYWLTLAIDCLLGDPNARSAWANVVFVNNLLPESDQCMKWTWSLAIEEQFYFVFPLLLIVFGAPRRSDEAHARDAGQRLGMALLLLFAAGVLVRFEVVRRYALHVPSADHARALYDALYDKPHGRYVELLAGALVAYAVIFHDARARLARAPIASTIAALVALVCAGAVSVVAQPIFVYEPSPHVALLYFALSHVIFASAVAVLLLVCVSKAGIGAPLGRALSIRPLHVVAQLSYSAYLIHVMIIDVGLDVGPFRPARTIGVMLGYLVVVPLVSLVAAAPLYLLVEKPLMRLRDRVPGAY